jgi:OOP family OmpA-OmpF porin
MKTELVVIGVVVAVAGAAVLVVRWLQEPDPIEAAMLEPLVVRQPSAPPAPAAPPAAELPASAAVLFEFDSDVLRAAETAKLDRLLEARGEGAPLARIDAVGHADRIGRADYNLKLSARRAAAVRDYFIGKSIHPAKLRTSARGELESATGDGCLEMGPPLRRNARLVACLQPDRRVEVSVTRSL